MLVRSLLLLGLIAMACAMPARDGDGRQSARRRLGLRLRRRFQCPADATRAECIQMVQDLIQRLRDAGQRPFSRRPVGQTDTSTDAPPSEQTPLEALPSDSEQNGDETGPGRRRGRRPGKKGGRRGDGDEEPTSVSDSDTASSGEGADEQSPSEDRPEGRRGGRGNRGRGRKGCRGRRNRPRGNATDEPPTDTSTETDAQDADSQDEDCERPEGRRRGHNGRRRGYGEGRRGRKPRTEAPTAAEDTTTEAV